MTDSQIRKAALTSAIEDLTWCTTEPHTIDQIIGIYAEAQSKQGRSMRHGLTNEQILATIAGGSGGGGKGGHADPTALAALWGEPDVVGPDETIGSIAAAIESLADHVDEAADLVAVAGLLARHGDRYIGRTGMLEEVVKCCRRIDAVVSAGYTGLPDEQYEHLQWLLRVPVGETADWLHRKAKGIWEQSRGERLQPAIQRELRHCTNCSKHGYTVLVERYAEWCRRCGDFQEREGFLPDEAICRTWDRGTSRITRTMVMEAKAKASAKRKAKAS